jgi:hypothetical protein
MATTKMAEPIPYRHDEESEVIEDRPNFDDLLLCDLLLDGRLEALCFPVIWSPIAGVAEGCLGGQRGPSVQSKGRVLAFSEPHQQLRR